MTATMQTNLRQATPAEMATLVRMLRDVRGWTQDTLAALSGLEVRTVQRVESGERSSRDTRRAIAGAFGFEDLDAFSKFPDAASSEEAEKQRQAFERSHLILDLELVDGRGIVSVLVDMGSYSAIGHQSLAELSREAQDAFAAILDYTRDCMDISDIAPKAEMLIYGDELQEHVDALKAAGQELFRARRKAAVKATGSDGGGRPFPLEILYLVAAPAGVNPGKVAVLKAFESGLG